MNPDPAFQIERLRQEIYHLELQLADVQARLPAHSLPPALLAQLDALDEQLTQLRQQLAQLLPPPT